MSMIEMAAIVRELDALGVIVQIDTDEHLMEALAEVISDDDSN